ncbi:MAG: hypothetical protein ACRC6U_00025 [Fusobacteriaceae bacterium]
MIITEFQKGEIQESERNLIKDLFEITKGDYKLAQELIAFRQIKDSKFFVNGIGQVVERVNGTISFVAEYDKGQYKRRVYRSGGYTQVKINNSKAYVHRLVTTNFLKDTTGLPKSDVNHKNFIRYENYLWNLEWCSKEYNSSHMQNFKQAKGKDGYIYTNLDIENYISSKEFGGESFNLEFENKIYLVKRKKHCIRKCLYLDFNIEFEKFRDGEANV